MTSVPDLVMSRSYTSRAARPGEVDGVDYNFVDEARFSSMVGAGEFLEWANVFDRRYGTSVADIERHLSVGSDVVMVIDVQGAQQVTDAGVKSIGVFVLPPSFAVLERRLRRRSMSHASEDEIRDRLGRARREVDAGQEYDYIIVNDDVDRCVDQLRSIVIAERARTAAVTEVAAKIIETFQQE